MNEIEQMYRNAGINPCEDCGDFAQKACYFDLCNYNFTAEKQLEIIKVLAQRTNVVISFNHSIRGWKISTLKRGIIGTKFDDVLANLVNAYWQDLTEDEKQKIREILK